VITSSPFGTDLTIDRLLGPLPITYAEQYASPFDAEIGEEFARNNDIGETFYLRWGKIRFETYGPLCDNIKVIMRVLRTDGVCEMFICDTDTYQVEDGRHKWATRDFFFHPQPLKLAPITAVRFSFIAHLKGVSFPSQHEYLLASAEELAGPKGYSRAIDRASVSPNTYRTYELDPALLQQDVEWQNGHLDSVKAIPKFTRGMPDHPYHPKRYIHDNIDRLVDLQRRYPDRPQRIKVCVDCIDDRDFVAHLLYAQENGVFVQCSVDWRKMTLSNSDNYVSLKRSRIELLGVFCTPKDSVIEVAPDMHNKFIIFGEADCIEGSFNIAFDRWGDNWETGMTFQSESVTRIFDNIFQSVRGGVIQRYAVDPCSQFNILYTFGAHVTVNGGNYCPHHAIFSEIQRARHSIRVVLFLMGELRGEHGDSVVDALIRAQQRGVNVQIVLNGHLARQGNPRTVYTLTQELQRPLLPAVDRLIRANIEVNLAYGHDEKRPTHCPIHSKYCVIDETTVIEGSFNWYNTSVFSHDLVVVANNAELARHYLEEFDKIQQGFRYFPSAALCDAATGDSTASPDAREPCEGLAGIPDNNTDLVEASDHLLSSR